MDDNYYSGTAVLNQGCLRKLGCKVTSVIGRFFFFWFVLRFTSIDPKLYPRPTESESLVWDLGSYNLMNCHDWKALDPKVISLKALPIQKSYVLQGNFEYGLGIRRHWGSLLSLLPKIKCRRHWGNINFLDVII